MILSNRGLDQSLTAIRNVCASAKGRSRALQNIQYCALSLSSWLLGGSSSRSPYNHYLTSTKDPLKGLFNIICSCIPASTCATDELSSPASSRSYTLQLVSFMPYTSSLSLLLWSPLLSASRSRTSSNALSPSKERLSVSTTTCCVFGLPWMPKIACCLLCTGICWPDKRSKCA